MRPTITRQTSLRMTVVLILFGNSAASIPERLQALPLQRRSRDLRSHRRCAPAPKSVRSQETEGVRDFGPIRAFRPPLPSTWVRSILRSTIAPGGTPERWAMAADGHCSGAFRALSRARDHREVGGRSPRPRATSRGRGDSGHCLRHRHCGASGGKANGSRTGHRPRLERRDANVARSAPTEGAAIIGSRAALSFCHSRKQL